MKKKKKSWERELEKERKPEGRSGKWKVEKTKREGMGYMGIHVWWRKIKRKKRKKEKRETYGW